MSVSATAVSDGGYYLRACDKHKAPKDRPEAHGPAAYELNAVAGGEPPGEWYGAGARALRLVGEIVPGQPSGDDFSTLVDEVKHPHTGEKLGSRPRRFKTAEQLVAQYRAKHPDATPEQVSEQAAKASTKRRKNVHAYDLGYGLPKSWSVLHAALEREGRTAEAALMWEAINAGVKASLDQAAEEHGWTRTGVGGPRVHGQSTTRNVRAPDWTMAMFRHHTSRDRDPQLHVHVMLLNRVQLPDGSWKAIHAAPLMRAKHQLDATFLRVAEAKLYELLGYSVATRPDGKAREILGVSQAVRDLFSSRSRALTERASELVDGYAAKHKLESVSPFIRWSILQYAARDSRKPKAQGITRKQDLARFEATMREAVRGGLDGVVADTDKARAQPSPALPWNDELVIDQALADLDSRSGTSKAVWNRSHLYHAISMRLPDRLNLPAEDIPTLLSALTEQALASPQVISVEAPGAARVPDSLRDARTGRSVFDAPEGERYTTAAHLGREDSLVARLDQVGAPTVPEGTTRALIAARHELDDQQADVAAAVMADEHRIVQIEAPAGSGKSRVVGAISDVSEQVYGHGLLGFTTAQNAAEVLAREGVQRAHNIAAYLDFLDRAQHGEVTDTERATFAVPRGATVVVDERTLVGTRDLVRLLDALDRAGAGKYVLVGDEEQAGAVDAGGAAALMNREREPYRLATIHRFHEQWERDASAEVRQGKVEALIPYQVRGRLHGSTDAEWVRDAAVEGFVRDYLDGEQSIIVTRTGEDASNLNSRVRAQLVRHGRVSDEGAVPLRDDTVAGVGDLVATRKNSRARGVVNREQWEVVGTTSHGALEVRRLEGRDKDTGAMRYGPTRTLDAEYTREQVELAYSGTVEAVQGRNPDTSHLLVTPGMGRSHFYPGFARGSKRNHAYAVLEDDKQTPLGRIGDVLEYDDREVAARQVIAQELERSEHLGHLGPQWQQLVIEDSAVHHRELMRQALGDDAQRVLEDPDAGGLLRLMRAAETEGHQPEKVLAAARGRGNLTGARSPARVLFARMDRELDRARSQRQEEDPDAPAVPFTYQARVRPVEHGARDNAERAYAAELARAMDHSVAELGQRVVEQWPAWAQRQWGDLPDDPLERQALAGRAAPVAAYREQFGWDDELDPIGPQPSRTEPERAWVWNRAADTMGLDRHSRDLAGLSAGELENRRQAWQREQTWGPRNVDDELGATHLAAERARAKAVEARAAYGEDLDLEAAAESERARVRQLEYVAQVRKDWYAETRDTRVAAEYAAAEQERRAELEQARQDDPVTRDVTRDPETRDVTRDVTRDQPQREIPDEDQVPAWAQEARRGVDAEARRAQDLRWARERAAERAAQAREREEQERVTRNAQPVPDDGRGENGPNNISRDPTPVPDAPSDEGPEVDDPPRELGEDRPVDDPAPVERLPEPHPRPLPEPEREPEEDQPEDEPQPEPVDELAARREAKAEREAEQEHQREDDEGDEPIGGWRDAPDDYTDEQVQEREDRAPDADVVDLERERQQREQDDAAAAAREADERAEEQARQQARADRDAQLRADVEKAQEAARIMAERREAAEREQDEREPDPAPVREDTHQRED